ncbi:MAG: hypothetical protein JWP47_2587 [Polaromonas sp.]|nr:hypothetical protein [Polaromonas sp.]
MNSQKPSDAAQKGKGSIWRTAKAVMWSFVGLRGKSDYEKDVEQLNPVHILVIGLIGVVVFVAVLMLIATLVVGR